MVQQLLKDCFRQAKRDSEISSKTGLCNYLSDTLTQEYNYPVSYKTLERLYNGYILETEPQREVKNELLECLARYRGFQSYADYIKRSHRKTGKTKEGTDRLSITAFVLIGLLIITLFGIPLYRNFTKHHCMFWAGDHFEKHDCNSLQTTERFKQERFQQMKKLEVDCSTEFFDANGKAQVYYDKIDSNTLVYYSYYGPSPESSDDLKPITNYMIEHYLDCDQ